MLTGGAAAAGPATPALVVAFKLSEKGAFLSAESVAMIHEPAKAWTEAPIAQLNTHYR